jgi:hypothetical protein
MILREGTDLESSEMALRREMHQVGGKILERLLNSDKGYRGVKVLCQKGHVSEFVEYRSKEIVTVLAPMTIERAYYHCKECGCGVIPRDEELDVQGTGFSPGVRRMMGHVGGNEAFDAGRRDLEVLAGVTVSAKAVERISEEIGKEVELFSRVERASFISGKAVSLVSADKLYVCLDGTGVPVVGKETEGRQGKEKGSRARTREGKLGCVFTQTALDEKGHPIRDEYSTTYVGAIETAEEFGWRLYGEALRRGLNRASKVILLGDGATWIWNLAEQHFPGAVQIVDLYHARQHLASLGNLLYGFATKKAKQWTTQRCRQLDAGNIEKLTACLRRLRPQRVELIEDVEKTVAYFVSNISRMRYRQFRKQGYFVGSGVVEAGCKTIMGQRLKQSGMHWTVRGANAIIALRCCQQSRRWEEFWEMLCAS